MKYVFPETGHGRLDMWEKEDISKLTRYVNDKLGNLCKFVGKVTTTYDGRRDIDKLKTTYAFYTVTYDFIKPIKLPHFSKMITNINAKTRIRVFDICQRDGDNCFKSKIVFKLIKK